MSKKPIYSLADCLYTRTYRFIAQLLLFFLLTANVTIIYSDSPLPSPPKIDGAISIPLGATLSIDQYQLVSISSFSKTLFDFTIKARLKNTGSTAVQGIKASVTSPVSTLTVVDRDVSFGLVKAKSNGWSVDTFTLRGRFIDLLQINKLKWALAKNLTPIANAGLDQSVQTKAKVFLNGSGSSDGDGDPLTYKWTLTAKPTGSKAVLTGATTVNPTFTADKAGNYTVQLVVNDGKVSSTADTVVISTLTINTAPVANAGANQSVVVGTLVQLDGSGSSDVDGNPLTYNWQVTTKPAGSLADVSNASLVNPTIKIDKAGSYSIQLTVNDGKLSSATSVVVISTTNSPPVANAGPDQSALVKGLVTFDGSASTDVDGDAITYSWSLISKPTGSVASLLTPSVVKPTFTIDKPGSYVGQLIVHDAVSDSAPDTVIVSTLNSKPVADPGVAQSVALNANVTLDGSQSSDADSDPLTYKWALITLPTGSNATLTNDTLVKPSFTATKPGVYVAQLIVNDGKVDSNPQTVEISTLNNQPLADAGANLSVTSGTLVTLDGIGSTDPDGDTLTYAWSLLSQPVGSAIALVSPTSQKPSFTPVLIGDYVAQLIVNDGKVNSDPSTVTVTTKPVVIPNRPPQITSTAVTSAKVSQAYSYDVNATDLDGDTLSYVLTTAPNGMAINSSSGLIAWTPTTAGNFNVVVTVTDGKGGEATQSFVVTVSDTVQTITVPYVVGTQRAAAEASIIGANLQLGTITFEHSAAPAGQVLSQNPVAGNAVTKGTAVALVVSLGTDNGLPADPKVIAPTIDPMVATTVDKASEFIYTGPNAIQTGVAPGTIVPKRVAVLRGKVMDKDNLPLPGVTVTVHDHPEFGQTLSRSDGMFDMVVNGGGVLTLDYRKDPYIMVQRQVNTPWQDYALVEDVLLIQLDSKVTAVDLTNAATVNVVQANPVTDVDGTRQATLLFPSGTQATMTLADGSTTTLTNFHVRATEFTVGANGPKTMPASLPPSTGYTYEVEYSVDEAVAAGATRVSFNHPLISYTENFIGFPVGTLVPYGEYDRKKGMWIASENGRVIKILSINQGVATLDIDGSGLAASAVDLSALGVGAEELQNLAALYSSGQTLWRVPIDHFLAIN